ncbi:MAG: nitroreductase family protein [Acidimicrobiales bacterium]
MAELLPLSLDELLTTTRSVRKRLDLTRPVPRNVVMECLEIAVQAPSGSNRQAWQFVVVEDAAKRKALADIYGEVFDQYMLAPASAGYQDGDTRAERRDAVSDSARYLRAHLHEVPVHLLAYQEGRTDGTKVSGQAGFWGSILPAVWSFMLAARARGLGSVWTTMTCRKEEEVAAVIGLDASRYSHAGLFPLAYTLGTDFKPAPRLPMDTVVHWNEW